MMLSSQTLNSLGGGFLSHVKMSVRATSSKLDDVNIIFDFPLYKFKISSCVLFFQNSHYPKSALLLCFEIGWMSKLQFHKQSKMIKGTIFENDDNLLESLTLSQVF